MTHFTASEQRFKRLDPGIARLVIGLAKDRARRDHFEELNRIKQAVKENAESSDIRKI